MNKNIKWIEIVVVLILVGMILGIAASPQSVSTITSTITSTSTFSTTFTTTSATTLIKTSTTTLPVTFTTTVTLVQPSGEVVGVYFSPKGGCAGQVAYWIGRANFLFMFSYSFTLDNIGDALIQAKGKEVDVKVVFEKSQVSQYSQYFKLKNAGLSVRK